MSTNIDIYEILIKEIIKNQQSILGPLAVDVANKVSGLKVYERSIVVTITGDKKKILEELVKQYESIFGQASVETCKDAIKPLISELKDTDLPGILR